MKLILRIDRFLFCLFFVASGLMTIAINAKQAEWKVKEEFLSPAQTDFDCHSSSIVETTPGSLCAVWKGGVGKGKSNIDMTDNVGVWLSLYDGSSWSTPKEIVHSSHSVCWNPILCKLSSEELLLFYRIGPDPRRTVSFLKRSSDGGHTWSSEEILPAGIVGPTKTKPIVTSDGTLICPSSIEAGGPEFEFKATACWIEISEDQGRSWSKIGPLQLPGHQFGVIEPTLFFDKGGNLNMLCRNRANRIGGKGWICQATSPDRGLHWSELKQISLPNPDSGIDVADFGNGRIVLVYNHSFTDRFPLNLAISSDGGVNWSSPLTLDDAGEMPAVIATSDGLVHITYAFASKDEEQRRIKHVIVDPTTFFKE
ncbi:MAG: exo-alpha-sialidase [Verrucomicrobia bacterium]|nr:exo-alpha-sialidase [Verrucomicrobiota bacterium]